jgi:hypothetical protein
VAVGVFQFDEIGLPAMDYPYIGNARDQSFALELRATDFTAAAVADGRDENVGMQGNP